MDEIQKKTIEVIIGYNVEREEIEYIKSDFMNEDLSYKNPIEYTAKLIEMGLETWIRDKIGLFCPDCDEQLEEGWIFCPSCGWSSNEKEE